LCPVKKHLAKVKALPKDKWKDEPGVVIVDAYAERLRKKRELDAEIKGVEGEIGELREAAIVFAEREAVQVIAGTEARLRVTGKERVVSPAKGSVEREALERELRAAGIWDEVSTLDASALEKAVAEGKWGPEVLARIKAYVSTEKRYTVTLKEEA
jgi:CRISPR/Cas system-associated exonuclease Cas4 (RecB family)